MLVFKVYSGIEKKNNIFGRKRPIFGILFFVFCKITILENDS
jgi:hypothetical protein